MPIEKPVAAAAKAAGWQVFEIDGHNDDLLNINFNSQNKPILILAHTIKGKGVSFMEGEPKWHSNWMGPELEAQALEELS